MIQEAFFHFPEYRLSRVNQNSESSSRKLKSEFIIIVFLKILKFYENCIILKQKDINLDWVFFSAEKGGTQRYAESLWVTLRTSLLRVKKMKYKLSENFKENV